MNLFKYIEGNTDLLLNNIEGKKILVLGSGPSATDIDWTKEEKSKVNLQGIIANAERKQ